MKLSSFKFLVLHLWVIVLFYLFANFHKYIVGTNEKYLNELKGNLLGGIAMNKQ